MLTRILALTPRGFFDLFEAHAGRLRPSAARNAATATRPASAALSIGGGGRRAAMGLGTLGGWRIVSGMGSKITLFRAPISGAPFYALARRAGGLAG
jgi:hypothetical protein